MSSRARDITLVGVDCAVQAKGIGIGVGHCVDGTVAVDEILVGFIDPAQVLAPIIREKAPVLLAFDSPLGWPKPMGQLLIDHQASAALPVDANHLFRRETDRFVKRKIGKQPLDVGADRIARTAHAAVGLLEQVRALASKEIPLAWQGHSLSETSCIEVYPAATLAAIGISWRGYKGNKEANRQARARLLGELDGILRLSDAAAKKAVASDDAFDAALCCVAAADFLLGNVLQPKDSDLARKEGWIWVRKP
ncbi:MAG: DUF429 domain-containing protein [Woeseia sp.]